ISFAATVATAVCRSGSSKICLSLGGKEIKLATGPASTGLLEEIMEQLALAEPQPNEQMLTLLSRGLEKAAMGTPVVVVSTRPLDFTGWLKSEAVPSSLSDELSRRRVDVIDVSSDQMDAFFTVE